MYKRSLEGLQAVGYEWKVFFYRKNVEGRHTDYLLQVFYRPNTFLWFFYRTKIFQVSPKDIKLSQVPRKRPSLASRERTFDGLSMESLTSTNHCQTEDLS